MDFIQKKLNLKSSHSFARRHVRNLRVLEKEASRAYDLFTKLVIAELKTYFQKNKLMKSSGWTGDVPKVKLNIDEISRTVIGRYTSALKWVLLGDSAGKEAKQNAKKYGFAEKFTPGILQASYLDAIDSNMAYFETLTGTTKEIPGFLLDASLEQIQERANRYFKQIALQIENNILKALNDVVENLNNLNFVKFQKDNEADIITKVYKTPLETELKTSFDNYKPNWTRSIHTEIGMSSSVGVHQSMNELFGSDDKDMSVIILTSKDHRVCEFCSHASTHTNGAFKFYKVSDFKPSGYNLGRKKAQWELCIPEFHYHCRCILVYVPTGFSVNSSGELIVEKYD